MRGIYPHRLRGLAQTSDTLALQAGVQLPLQALDLSIPGLGTAIVFVMSRLLDIGSQSALQQEQQQITQQITQIDSALKAHDYASAWSVASSLANDDTLTYLGNYMPNALPHVFAAAMGYGITSGDWSGVRSLSSHIDSAAAFSESQYQNDSQEILGKWLCEANATGAHVQMPALEEGVSRRASLVSPNTGNAYELRSVSTDENADPATPPYLFFDDATYGAADGYSGPDYPNCSGGDINARHLTDIFLSWLGKYAGSAGLSIPLTGSAVSTVEGFIVALEQKRSAAQQAAAAKAAADAAARQAAADAAAKAAADAAARAAAQQTADAATRQAAADAAAKAAADAAAAAQAAADAAIAAARSQTAIQASMPQASQFQQIMPQEASYGGSTQNQFFPGSSSETATVQETAKPASRFPLWIVLTVAAVALTMRK